MVSKECASKLCNVILFLDSAYFSLISTIRHIPESCDCGALEDAIIFPSEIILRKKPGPDLNSYGTDYELDFEFKNPKKCPIIAIVNKRSGGSLGEDVLAQFYQYLNPIQVKLSMKLQLMCLAGDRSNR